jgi:ABC-2 type transport system ATP-binding protein
MTMRKTSGSPSAIVTKGLTPRFGKRVAVNALDLNMSLGGVIGLVGPNESGALIIIRMLLGPIRPSAGTVEVLG